MKGIYRDGYYDGSIEPRDVFNRRCVQCVCRGDFGPARTMRIRTGLVFWNLIFSLMFTCVKGTTHCSKPLCCFFFFFLMRLVRACVRACVREIKKLERYRRAQK
uniref:Uncharacterized protein n=1 Tax=Cyclopterus lumpus TaxID=8103 RepID=A0A8C2X1L2_CYCLU